MARATTFMVAILSGALSTWPRCVRGSAHHPGMERSGFVVAIALVLLMVPLVVRSTEEMLKIVPQICVQVRRTRSASPSGRRSRRSCCPPRCRASSPA